MTINNKKLPLVVICGRANVGKSTLFNCLIENKQALVSNIAGTTRDSNLGLVEWSHSAFNLVDTAGLIKAKTLNSKKIKTIDIESQTQKQALSYLEQADLILLLVDTKAGLLLADKELANSLKNKDSYRKKTLVVANKVDNEKLISETAQFNKLGLNEPINISAATGMGTGDLLDIVIDKIDKKRKNKKTYELEENKIKICIIGKPNVGKSSLLNAILGYKRVIVSPVAHTTREPQNTTINYKDYSIDLIDTAGISKQGKKSDKLEKHGILKTLKSLDKADIALLVIDISEAISHQDAHLVQEIVDRGKSLIFIANKWDKLETRDPKEKTAEIYDRLPFATWAPIQFIAAKTGKGVNKILNLIIEINKQRKLKLSDSQCEKFMKAVIKIHKPAKGKGLKAPHLYEFKQVKNNPPSFTVRIGPNDNLHFSYLRFMKNRLRERHGFIATPIHIRVTKDKKSHTTYNE